MTGIFAALVGFLAILGGALAWVIRQAGRKDAALDRWEAAEKRRKAGENAADKERKKTDSASDDVIRDRLRKRDDDWRGV